jgi:DNA-binding transcriptional LysR family regulator
MNLAAIELKLLVVFDALMTERRVSLAARRIGMSQPAMSNALNRLRHLLKDQLFIRSAEGMRPTPRAIELSMPIASALKQIQEALEPHRFDPADADWVCNLALSDQATVVILPRLLALLSRTAPRIRLRIRPKSNLLVQDQLEAAEIDLAVGVMPTLARRFDQAVLFHDRYVCMVCKDHPLAGKPITVRDFGTADHLVVRPSLDRESRLDQELRKLGQSRKVILNVTQFLSVPQILPGTRLVACLLQSVAQHFDPQLFYCAPVPFPVGPIAVTVAWTKARAQHAAIAWMRQQLAQACKAL